MGDGLMGLRDDRAVDDLAGPPIGTRPETNI